MLDYRGRDPFKPEPRPTVRSALGAFRPSVILATFALWIALLGGLYLVAVALGLAW